MHLVRVVNMVIVDVNFSIGYEFTARTTIVFRESAYGAIGKIGLFITTADGGFIITQALES